ncbi:alpha/beta fold hydrolase [Vagococcus salmoninarum]|uniref:Alpha/beta hydrolase n=1 Tax=Vagococcus salmoninarum TaxID=2739 RepID=A0A429ZSK0_9ENTE|nr:alpha/beta fold hydrolase [Vagococcus salmoninarum]RST96608.1 hypothetical protein CBF35_05090 [Vagococcus salmoninarum]
MKLKKWLISSLVLSASVIVSQKILKQLNKQSKFKQLKRNHTQHDRIPTLLIHGTNGTRRSLGGMIERWGKQGLAYKALEVEVSRDGELTLTGNWQELHPEQQPLIQVIFKEGNPPEWQQGEWLKNILELLKQELQIQKVQMLGHSMGGVAILRYLVDYGQDNTLPKVSKVVALGTPFNSEEVSSSGKTKYDLGTAGPLTEYPTYRYLKAYYQNLPRELSLLNIYGDLKNGSRSDGFVSVDSAKAIRFLIKGWIETYSERQVLGVRAQHSLLHENKQVDRLAANFLWGHQHLHFKKGGH